MPRCVCHDTIASGCTIPGGDSTRQGCRGPIQGGKSRGGPPTRQAAGTHPSLGMTHVQPSNLRAKTHGPSTLHHPIYLRSSAFDSILTLALNNLRARPCTEFGNLRHADQHTKRCQLQQSTSSAEGFISTEREGRVPEPSTI